MRPSLHLNVLRFNSTKLQEFLPVLLLKNYASSSWCYVSLMTPMKSPRLSLLTRTSISWVPPADVSYLPNSPYWWIDIHWRHICWAHLASQWSSGYIHIPLLVLSGSMYWLFLPSRKKNSTCANKRDFNKLVDVLGQWIWFWFTRVSLCEQTWFQTCGIMYLGNAFDSDLL